MMILETRIRQVEAAGRGRRPRVNQRGVQVGGPVRECGNHYIVKRQLRERRQRRSAVPGRPAGLCGTFRSEAWASL